MEELIKKNYQLIDRLSALHGASIKIRTKAIRSNRFSVTSLSAKDFIYNNASGDIIEGHLHTKYAEVRNYMSIGESQVQGVYLLQDELDGSCPNDIASYGFNYGWHISTRINDVSFYVDYQSDLHLFAVYLTINNTEILLEDWLNQDLTLYDFI